MSAHGAGTPTLYILRSLLLMMLVLRPLIQIDSKDSTIGIEIRIHHQSPPTGPLRHAQFSSGRTQILRLYGSSSVPMSGGSPPCLSRTGSLLPLPSPIVSYQYSRVGSHGFTLHSSHPFPCLHRSYFAAFLPFPRVSGWPCLGIKPSSYLGTSSANEYVVTS